MQIDHYKREKAKWMIPKSWFNHCFTKWLDCKLAALLWGKKLLKQHDKVQKPTLFLIRSISNRSRIMSSKQEERLRCVTQHCRSTGRQPRFQDEAPSTFNRPLVNWPEASTLTKPKELIHLTAWMSGLGLETQFGSKLESDVMVIKWEKWRHCGQDLVNSSCKGLQIPSGLSNCSLSEERLPLQHTGTAAW